MKKHSDWFTVEQVAEGTYAISEYKHREKQNAG